MLVVDTLTKNGMSNAAALVEACARVGLPVYVGAAFAQHESNGQNIYGHDVGGAMCGAGQVTEGNYRQFLTLVRGGHRSNGVGPMQITYPGYFKANTPEVANLWQPLYNFIFGLKIIKGYLGSDYSPSNLNVAGQRYNSGRPNGAPQYGAITVQLAQKWLQLLGPDVVPTPAPAPVVGLPTLQQGSAGLVVGKLQAFLVRVFPAYAGPILKSGGIDKQFGAGTKSVVEEFQRRSGLVADGIVGSHTWSALEKDGFK